MIVECCFCRKDLKTIRASSDSPSFPGSAVLPRHCRVLTCQVMPRFRDVPCGRDPGIGWALGVTK